MDVDHQEEIQRFADLTGISEDRATYFLEAADWNFEVAAGTYFETLEDDVEILEQRPDIEIVEPSPVPIVEEPPESNERYLSSSSDEDDDIQVIGRQASSSKKPESKTGNMSGKKFATLHDNSKSDEGDSGSEEGSDKGQTFFAGGGQQVVGPKRQKKPPVNPGELVTDVFKKAKEHGAEAVDPSEMDAGRSSSSRQTTFQGGVYRLGDSATPAERIAGAPYPAGGAMERMTKQTVAVVLRMWEDGFSLDDGPLRPYDDPESREFIDSIRAGEIPTELRTRYPGREIDLQMENHHGEKFKPQPMKPFTGKGQKLGSYAPSIITAVHDHSAASASSNGETNKSEEVKMEIDENLPVTSIQIRLANGTRIVQKFNMSHRISDIRQFICRSHAEFETREFVLMTNFPNRELTDENATLEEAGLKNAVVVQKLKER